MDAVTVIAEEMEKMDVISQKKFQSLLEEFSGFHSILQQLVEIYLDMLNQVQVTFVPYFEYPVIQDIEKAKDIYDQEKNSLKSDVNNFLITVGSLQINSLANTLGETFKEFETQTTTLADIYYPSILPELSQIVQIPQYTESGNSHENRFRENFDREPDIRSANSIINSLNQSANILHNLESIKTSIIEMYTGQNKSTSGTSDLQGLTSDRSLSENNVDPKRLSRSDLSNFLSGSSDHMRTYPEAINTILTGLHDIMKESEKVASIPYPKLVVEDQSIPKESFLFETDRGSSGGSLSTKIPGVAPTIESKKLGRKSTDKPMSSIGTGIIEIPALVPTIKNTLPSYDKELDAVHFSEGMKKLGESGSPILFEDSKKIPSLIRTIPSTLDYSLPSISVPNSFGKISEYLTYISEIHHQITSPMHDRKGTDEFNPLDYSLIIPLPTGSIGMPILSNIMSYGGNEMSTEQNPIMELAMNAMPLEVMKREALLTPLVVGPPQHPLFQTDTFNEGSLAAAPRVLDNALQMISRQIGETAAPSSTGSNAFHFQNTFNIVVNTKSAGDESGLRELGRKIGLILSEEIKRYGGLR